MKDRIETIKEIYEWIKDYFNSSEQAGKEIELAFYNKYKNEIGAKTGITKYLRLFVSNDKARIFHYILDWIDDECDKDIVLNTWYETEEYFDEYTDDIFDQLLLVEANFTAEQWEIVDKTYSYEEDYELKEFLQDYMDNCKNSYKIIFDHRKNNK